MKYRLPSTLNHDHIRSLSDDLVKVIHEHVEKINNTLDQQNALVNACFIIVIEALRQMPNLAPSLLEGIGYAVIGQADLKYPDGPLGKISEILSRKTEDTSPLPFQEE